MLRVTTVSRRWVESVVGSEVGLLLSCADVAIALVVFRWKLFSNVP